MIDTGKRAGLPMIAWIVYTGARNFAVTSYGADGERIDLLVNVIGAYDGKVPVDWLDDEHTTRLEIESSGDWTITLLPLARIRVEEIPGRITGTGDDVIFLRGGNIDLVTIDASKAKSNFAIWTWGDTGRDLLVNEIAPYTGTSIAESGMYILQMQAEGPWVLGVTKR